jgi:cell wall-associated NlpC family hydrolase
MLDQGREEPIKRFIARALGTPFRDQGREFTGWDCWGLILLAFRQCFGLELPDLATVSALNSSQVGRLFTAHSRQWQEVVPGRERPGDVALLRRGRWPCHVGLVVQPGLMLHVDPENGTCIEFFRQGALAPRLVGIYRHEQLAGI